MGPLQEHLGGSSPPPTWGWGLPRLLQEAPGLPGAVPALWCCSQPGLLPGARSRRVPRAPPPHCGSPPLHQGSDSPRGTRRGGRRSPGRAGGLSLCPGADPRAGSLCGHPRRTEGGREEGWMEGWRDAARRHGPTSRAAFRPGFPPGQDYSSDQLVLEQDELWGPPGSWEGVGRVLQVPRAPVVTPPSWAVPAPPRIQQRWPHPYQDLLSPGAGPPGVFGFQLGKSHPIVAAGPTPTLKSPLDPHRRGHATSPGVPIPPCGEVTAQGAGARRAGWHGQGRAGLRARCQPQGTAGAPGTCGAAA